MSHVIQMAVSEEVTDSWVSAAGSGGTCRSQCHVIIVAIECGDRQLPWWQGHRQVAVDGAT